MKTMADYKELIEDRPAKMTEEESAYQDAEGKESCGKCLHFFQRKIDGFGVCEVVRPDDDGPVEPDYVCDFFTVDGDVFPLRPRAR